MTKPLELPRILVLAAVLLATILTSSRAASRPSDPPANPDFASQVVAEINFARTHPQDYAETLRRGPRSPATDEAIAFVERQAPLPPVEANAALAMAAAGFAADAGPLGVIGHTGSDGSTAAQRMQREGAFSPISAEDIALGQTSPQDVVRQLVIDENVPSRLHRGDIFHPLYRFAGVGCGPHRIYRSMCVIDFTGAIMTAGAENPPGAEPPPQRQEPRFVPGEVVIEVADDASPDDLAALGARHGLAILESLRSELSGTTLLRARILDRRAVEAIVEALGGDAAVISVQPNYLYELEQRPDATPLQYAPARLRLAQAHALARGANVLVGMIDSGVDANHPELAGAVVGQFEALRGAGGAASHGTAIASLIAAHGKLMGAAPAARLLTVRAFNAAGGGGTSFAILQGLDWLAAKGARVINMSFAGPPDPALHRGLAGAYARSIVLIAAAGNAGPRSPPLFPAADPRVIAIAASDSADQIDAGSNRGRYIVLAAPGVDIMAASPDGGYQIGSGTSFAAAEASGVAALILERHPRLGPDAVRALLAATARSTGADPAAPRLIDAYRAVEDH